MQHYVKNLPLDQNFSKATNEIVVGAGCFWGVEKKFWDLPGVLMTSVGYSGGETDNTTYEDVCYKNTNHVEVVKITFDEDIISLKEILKIFCHKNRILIILALSINLTELFQLRCLSMSEIIKNYLIISKI